MFRSSSSAPKLETWWQPGRQARRSARRQLFLENLESRLVFSLAATDWPMFGRNLQHTAQSDSSAVATGDIARVIHSNGFSGLALGTNSTGREIIYTANLQGYGLAALDVDGTLQWWSNVVGNSNGVTPALGSDGTIYVAPEGRGTVYAIDPELGTVGSDKLLSPEGVKWTFSTGNTAGFQQSSPAVDADGTVYIGSLDGYLYALDGGTGSLQWKYKTREGIMSSPAVSADGATVYVGSKDNNLYALNAGSGTLKWRFGAGADVFAPAVGADGTIYVTTAGLKIIAVGSNGSQKWSASLGKAAKGTTGYATYPAIASDGAAETIVAGGPDGLYAFTAAGVQKWKYATTQQNYYQPAIDAAGRIYVTSSDGKMHAVGANGKPLWTKDVFGATHFWHGSPVIAADGSVLVDGAGGLITFRDGGVGLPSILYIKASPDPNHASNINLATYFVGDAPGGTVATVAFYRDANANRQFDAGDVLLGTDSSGSRFSKLSIPAPETPGDYTYFAQAQDDVGYWSNVVTTNYTLGSPLQAAGHALPGRGLPAESLTQDTLTPIVHEAFRRWQAAGVAVAALGDVHVQLADLSGTTLGLAAGSTIVLDTNAAGWGWFVDRTPDDDSEFILPGNQGERNRMDLLTVVTHELGHLLGHGHVEDGAMAEMLVAGVRRTEGEHRHVSVVDQLFTQSSNSRAESWLGVWWSESLRPHRPAGKRRK